MTLLALEPAPATEPDWLERAKKVRLEQHGAATELMRLFSRKPQTVDDARAIKLLTQIMEGNSELLGIVLKDLRFWQWAAATWYHRATGSHVESGAGDGTARVRVDGNVHDIREVLAQQRR